MFGRFVRFRRLGKFGRFEPHKPSQPSQLSEPSRLLSNSVRFDLECVKVTRDDAVGEDSTGFIFNIALAVAA